MKSVFSMISSPPQATSRLGSADQSIGSFVGILTALFLITGVGQASGQILTGGGTPNATFDSGAAGADMLLWLRADAGVTFSSGTLVSGWADQSTYGRDASQANVAQQPTFAPATLGVHPTLQFTNAASSQLALGANAFSGHQTMFVVYNDTSTADWVTPVGTAYTGKGTYHGNNGDGAIFNTTHTDPNTLNGNNYRNGTPIGSGTSTARPDAFSINAYRAAGPFPAGQNITTIGADSCCSNRSINGGIAEILVYDRQLTNTELDAVGNYLGSKYGLTWTDIMFAQPSNSVSLADIVTGGDGTGIPNTNNGINKLTGTLTTGHDAGVIRTGAGFQAVPGLAFVNGVNVPDGGAGAVQFSTAGGTITGLPNTTNQTWDYVLATPSTGGFSTLSGVDYNNVNGHTMIDLHTNTLLTFDLNAIEAFHGGEIDRFTGVVGAPNPNAGDSTLQFDVYLDGVLADTLTFDNLNRTIGFALDIPISDSDQYLTLVATDLGNSIGYDQIIVGDAVLHFAAAAVPEPQTVAAWIACLAPLLGWVAIRRTGLRLRNCDV
jgi:hypothetical protein